MRKSSAVSSALSLIARFHRATGALSDAILADRDDETIRKLDRKLDLAFRDIADWPAQTGAERIAIIDFALDMIEARIDGDTTLLHFTTLIRRNIER